jgi:hypothetical protein
VVDSRAVEKYFLASTVFDAHEFDSSIVLGIADQSGFRYLSKELPIERIEVASRRFASGGALGIAGRKAYLLDKEGNVITLPGLAAAGTFPWARSVVGGPSGTFAVWNDQQVSWQRGKSGIDFTCRQLLGEDLELGDLVLIDDRTMAFSAWPKGAEPWMGSRVVIVTLQGGKPTISSVTRDQVVEPRLIGGELYARAEDGEGFSVFRITRAGATTDKARPETVGCGYDVGEAPLGSGSASFAGLESPEWFYLPALDLRGLYHSSGALLHSGSAVGGVKAVSGQPMYLFSDIESGVGVRLGGSTIWRSQPAHDLDLTRTTLADWFLSEPVMPGVVYLPEHVKGIALILHGGPIEQVFTGYNPKYRFLLDNHLAVVLPDYPGSFGYGSKYRMLLHQAFGIAEVGPLAALAVRLRELFKLPLLGFGASSAGYSLLKMLEQSPGIFDALVLSFPLTTLDLDDYLCSWLRPPGSERFPALPSSSRCKILITHGTADAVVPVQTTREFVSRYRSEGFIRYAEFLGEGHGYRVTAQMAELRLISNLLAELFEN